MTDAPRRRWLILGPFAIGLLLVPVLGEFSTTFDHPVARALLTMAGPTAGLLVGVLLVRGRHRRATGFARVEEVHQILHLPVLGVVPVMLPHGQGRAQDLKWRILDLSGYVLLIVAAGVVLLWGLQQ